MPSIIASRPTGVNHEPASERAAQTLTYEQRLRLERRQLADELSQIRDRPCLPNADAWDENVAKPTALKLCQGCPVAASKACGRVTTIDEALVYASSGRGDSYLHMIVSGTRAGMNPRARRPLVKELAEQIVDARISTRQPRRAGAA